MAFDPKAHLAKLKSRTTEAEAPESKPQFDPRAHLSRLKSAEQAAPGAPPGRLPNARQRAKMDRAPSPMDLAGDITGGLNTAIFDVVDLPSTVYNLGADVMGAPGAKVPPTMSALRPYVAGRPEGAEQADSGITDFLRTFAEWGGGAGAMQRGVSKAPDIAMAGGAATGEAIGGETGELIGGLTGAASPYAPAMFNKLFGEAGEEAKLKEIAEFLRNNMTDAEMQQTRRATSAGEEGTLGDLSRSRGVNRVELALGRERPEAADAFSDAYRRREGQVGQQFDETLVPAGAETEVPRQQALADAQRNKDRITDVERGMVEGVEGERRTALTRAREARESAMAAEERLGGAARTDETSRALSEEFRRLDDDLREEVVRPAWKEFEEVKEIETQKLQDDLSKVSEDMPAYMREDLNSQYKTIMNKLQNMEDIADPRDIQYVLSAIKQVNREARANNSFGVLNTQLSDIRNVVDDALAKNERVGPQFQEAIAATLEQKTRMGGKRGSQALSRTEEDPELFVESLGGFVGNKGAGTADRILRSKDEGVINAGKEALRSELRRTKLTEDTLTQYEPALARFPDVREDVATAVANRQTLDEVEKGTQETQRLLDQSIKQIRSRADKAKGGVKNLTMSRFADKPNDFIDSALKEKDDSGSLGRLYNRFAKQGEEYGEAFKSKVLSRLKSDIMDADRVEKGLADKIDRLMKNGIVTDANKQEIVDIIAMQEGRRQRRMIKNANRGALDASVGNQEVVDDGVSTALTLPVLSVLPSSHQLMAAGMLKRNFRRMIRQKRLDPARLERLTELMSDNPQRFIDLIDGKITKDTPPEKLADMFERAMVRTGIVSGNVGEE